MAFDWKSTLGMIAPALASAIGSPLAGKAVSILGQVVLGNNEASESQIATVVQAGLPPDIVMRLRDADSAFQTRMRELDLSEQQLYVQDTEAARSHHSAQARVFWLGVAVLVSFTLVCAISVFGGYHLLFNSSPIPEGLLAAVFSLIGATMGYAASNAQSVVNFYFGSSRGSDDKTRALAEGFKSLGRR